MKDQINPAWRLWAIAVFLAGFTPRILAIDGTFTVTETWSATLTYSNWGDQNYSGTKQFSSTQTGTITVRSGDYLLLDQSGIPAALVPVRLDAASRRLQSIRVFRVFRG